MHDRTTIRQATNQDAAAIADIHLRSRQAAMPWLAVVHSDEETHCWMANVMLVNDDVWVAESSESVAGYIALGPGWIEHLYIDPERQGRGIGRRLLDLAKERQPVELQLFAFARNQPARRFYEAAGFIVIGESDGAENEEREPDVRYRWRP